MKVRCLYSIALLGSLGLALAGCADDPAQQGTYTAARHNMVGSHIPQPDSAASASNTYDGSTGTGANMTSSAPRSIGGGSR